PHTPEGGTPATPAALGVEPIVTTTPVPAPTPADGHPDKGQDGPPREGPEWTGNIGRPGGGSLAVGRLAAFLLAAAPFISPEEDDVTGAVLCGFATGWGVLGVPSVAVPDSPQR